MAKRYWFYTLIAPALVVTALFMGCFGSKAVTMAVVAPLTGDDAEEGKSIVNAVQLAVDEWNQKGGLFGKPIKLVSKDDKESPETAVTIANELSDDKVSAVIGHYTSNCTLAARDVYSIRKTLMITPSSTNPAITDGIYATIFRVCGRDDEQGQAAASYVAKMWPDAKIALLYDNSSYGKDLADRFLAEFTSKTKKESVLYTHFDRSVMDFSSVVREVKEKEPTVVYFGGLFLQGAELLKTLRKEGVTATFVSGDGCWNKAFVERAGASVAEGSLVTFNPKPEGTGEGHTFTSDYKSKFGADPHPYSLYAYTATIIALNAIQKAGTKDSIAVAQVMRSQEFTTPLGAIKFNEKGDPAESPWTVWKIENGKFELAPLPPDLQPEPEVK